MTSFVCSYFLDFDDKFCQMLTDKLKAKGRGNSETMKHSKYTLRSVNFLLCFLLSQFFKGLLMCISLSPETPRIICVNLQVICCHVLHPLSEP